MIECHIRPSVAFLSLTAALAVGCAPPAGKLGDVVEEESEGSSGEELPPEGERMAVIEVEDRALDLLFVIDNSGSMGAKQASATAAIDRFMGLVELVDLDLRVAFTTTDDGNPWCQGTSPEAGQLRMSACTERLTEFVFEGAETLDATQEACLDLCELSSIPQRATTTHVDEVAALRPWIEVGPTGTNLDGVTPEQAVRCAASQGINGCGFESPLESMRKTIERSASPSDPAYGFLRPWARFGVVFVTDEVDCSVDAAWDEVFLPDGNRVFWGDPGAPAPTSSVCWNAGVQCQAESGDLGACNPQNYDVEGNVTDAAGAVMRSLTHYIEDLQAVETSKALYRPEGGNAVAVTVIGGINDDGTVTYQRGGNQDFNYSFGVDPGCSDASGGAVPPVRLRALAELFPVQEGDRNLFSVCDSDFGPALESLAEVAAQPDVPMGCVPGCVADAQADAEGLQPDCDVILTRAGATERESVLLADCDSSDSSGACYRMHIGDDFGLQCAEQGSNVGLELVLSPDDPIRGQATVEVVCEMAPEGSC